MSDSVLSLLGLCKRAGMLVAGEEPVEGVARAKDARVLFLAADAADNTKRRCVHFAEMGSCLWLRLPYSKEELGRSLGLTVCAISAVTDISFACAIVHRLAETDPVRYDEAAAKLDLKAERAQRRKEEQRAHEKNLRKGKKRTHAAPAPEETPPQAQPGRRAKSPAAQRSRSGGYRRRREVQKAEARNRYAGSRPVKKGKGSKPGAKRADPV